MQPLTGQSGDRDYNTRKESADAAENQNIFDFGHALPRKAQAITQLGFSAIACVEEFGSSAPSTCEPTRGAAMAASRWRE